ncbi:MAG: DUF1249 domain-containing protein [Methylococcaceae bacterium]|nr:DUF1249 domain-containing protein [Methylococcaceae bacterium]
MACVDPINKSWCLEQLCEANYQKLLRLVPDLLSIQNQAIGTAQQKMALQLHILDRSPFTMTIELNHRFEQRLDPLLLPAIKIRVYQDAKCAEVLSDHVRADVAKLFKDPSQSVAIMNYKWRLNYFLSKWLDHCLCADYQFQTEQLVAV